MEAATAMSSSSSFLSALRCSHSSNPSDHLRRPKTLTNPKPTEPQPLTTTSSNKQPNPLRIIRNPNLPPTASPDLSSKLWLSSKLNPPPPPPTPPLRLDSVVSSGLDDDEDLGAGSSVKEGVEFRQTGKIFVGNLSVWIKKDEVAQYFRQFGPISKVILIKGHNEMEKNAGFCFVIYGGPTAESSALKAVEFDGVEFHGRILTVKLDDGKRNKGKMDERQSWLKGGSDQLGNKSGWHGEREGRRSELQRVLDTQPENWQVVVCAFEKINKVCILIPMLLFR